SCADARLPDADGVDGRARDPRHRGQPRLRHPARDRRPAHPGVAADVTQAIEPSPELLVSKGRRRLERLWSLTESRAFVVAASTLLAILAYTIVVPGTWPYGANEVDLSRSAEGPSWTHPFGTDQLGRDLFSRIAAGGQTTLIISGAALSIILAIGVVWGTTAAVSGGKVDAAMMRVVDGLFAIPRLPVAIVVLVALRLRAQNVGAIVFALSIVGWMLTARLVRGQ